MFAVKKGLCMFVKNVSKLRESKKSTNRNTSEKTPDMTNDFGSTTLNFWDMNK